MSYRSIRALVGNQEVIGLGAQATVQQAAETMARHRIGAVPVMESGSLIGLFTERDLLNRVVAKGLRPETLHLEEVMTRDPVTAGPDQSLVDGLSIMAERGFRHLPVLEDGRILGILSCRDIPAEYWIMWENWTNAKNDLKAASG